MPLLVQEEDEVKEEQETTGTALAQESNEDTSQKVSIQMPDDKSKTKPCHPYSIALHRPGVSFIMSLLIIFMMAVWWLIFI